MLPSKLHSINPLKISYEICQKSDNPSNIHEAIIRNDLVHAPGYGLFATPSDISETDPVKVSVHWLDIDPNWQTLSSYGLGETLNIETIPELVHAIYVAGKTRLYKIGDNSSPVFLSLYGQFDMEDQKIMVLQQNLWVIGGSTNPPSW